MKKSINSRVDDLEKGHGKRPMIAIFEDRDDPNLWHPARRESDPISWAEVEAEYDEYLIIKVTYEKEKNAKNS